MAPVGTCSVSQSYSIWGKKSNFTHYFAFQIFTYFAALDKADLIWNYRGSGRPHVMYVQKMFNCDKSCCSMK